MVPQLPTPVYAGLLLRSVPAPVRRDAHVALGMLAPWGHVTPQLVQDTGGGVADHDLHVDGRLVQLPYRLSHPWPSSARTARQNRRAQTVLAAWMTRSDRAGTRQRAVRELFASDEPWTAPFVVALCGEYVYEIGADVLGFVCGDLVRRDDLRAAYARFLRDNPSFLAVLRRRAVSFRDLDHRWPHRDEPGRIYPQLAALDALGMLAYGGPVPVPEIEGPAPRHALMSTNGAGPG
ncbi:hypothetical protein EV378_5157 [Pseudonocardia endophytica]|uniref:Uncharacterized protein n=1 Tax=Pseudonocardia endophytica TaxID=401976 RepID=A0A4R1HHG4_PSEEN|nr:hypothetical protein EV378_5157 [Pseudonocardia endophytica]